MSRVRTSVSLGTVAVVVLGGLSLGLGSVSMPDSSTLGGPVVLSARPEASLPPTAAPDGTAGPSAPVVETGSTEPVGVRAPAPVRAEADRSASEPTTGDSPATTRTSGNGASVPTSDPPAAGGLGTSGPNVGGTTHAPSRSEALRDAATTSGQLTTGTTSEDSPTHDRP